MSGQDPVAWLRAQVEARRGLALRATEPGDLRGTGARLANEWQTGCICEAECQGYPACEEVTGDGIHIYSEGGHDADQAARIAANDPQDTIARCEAELAILDEHAAEWEDYRDGDGIERTSLECSTCEPPGTPDNYPCRTVRLLASGYKHRPGYEEAWKPSG